MNQYSSRIEELRSIMRGHGWDAVIVTGQDPHCSEYPAERWKQVEWLTGFSGEAGDVVVTLDHAGLWTDTRYFIQAVAQLDGTGVVLHKTRVPDQVLIPEWLEQEFPEGAVVAVDGLCRAASDTLDSRFTVVSVPDMLSSLWQDRPAIPQTPIFLVETGESRESKLDWLRSVVAAKGCTGILLTALDDIAWTLNVRASDIEYNPLVISYLLVTEDSVRWFVLKDPDLDPDTAQTLDFLRDEGVMLEQYSDIEMALAELQDDVLWVDSGSLNLHLSTLLNCETVAAPSPVQLRKAVKNSFEIDGMRECHIRDGVAMEKFLYWLEKSIQADRRITEWDAAVKLGQYRAEIPDYQGDSFEIISAYGPGAALPHYITPHGDAAPVLQPHGLYLCDSGGQYLSGTTDITRTVPLGDCTPLEIEDYTLVLKGHIGVEMAVFPTGTAGCQIDALAREPLWAAHRSFGHGTGHGVGFFLGVHEGPHDMRQNFNSVALKPGMIITDEPGIYREGQHGIRHENVLLCVEDSVNEFASWLKFESLTMCHYDTSCLDASLLTEAEREWLNNYNALVYDTLAPLLPEEVADWLLDKTAAI